MSFIVAPLVSVPLNIAFAGSFANTDLDNVDSVANYAWGGVDQATIGARCMTTGAETYTIASGAVTLITGTTIDGLTPAVGDVIFIPTAPTSSGVGTAVSAGVGSSSAANGVYVMTGSTGGIQVARHTTMSTVAANKGPAGRVVFVRDGTANGFTMWTVKAPLTNVAFTYGSTAIQWQNYFATIKSPTITSPTITTPTISSPVFTGTGVPNAAIQQAGINNFNTSLQTQAMVAATSYYVAGSKLTMPATPLNGMVANATTFIWNIAIAKNANGTGTFSVIIFRGTNGTTADTADVTQSIGTQNAALDNMMLTIQLTVTTTGATGAYYWSIIPDNKAVTATGFGCAVGSLFNGTVSSVAMNTASLKFGIGVVSAAGGTLPTITIPTVQAWANNMN